MLAECLSSLAEQTTSRDDYEVVVVDNGSTDGTSDWLAGWAAEGPHRRVVREPAPGLSRARNRGVEAAGGEVVLFLDDDAWAPRGWVAAHLGPYDDDPQVVMVGGPVVLEWPHGRPGWLAPRLEHWFSALDLGDQRRPFPTPHGPYGTNMSVRRRDLCEAGPFSDQLGRRGRSLLSAEEYDLSRRLWRSGAAIAYDPATLVVHRVMGDRVTRRWVLRRGWAQGRSNARARVLTGRLDGRQLVDTCRAEAAHAVRDPWGMLRTLARWDLAAVLDEVARRIGHLSAVGEHLWLWAVRAAPGVRAPEA
jgi:glycosyltransferase involved in cell wall biosynthesis